jgi:hypothetical protein
MSRGHANKPNDFAKGAASIIVGNETDVDGATNAFRRLRDAQVLFTNIDKGSETAFALGVWDYLCVVVAELQSCCRVDMLEMLEAGMTEENVAAWLKLLERVGPPRRQARGHG